jgi:hypothetical protein
MLFQATHEDGSRNDAFIDVKSIDDIDGLLLKMSHLVAKYKKMSPAEIAYLSYPELVTQDVPLEFTVKFPSWGETTNWDYENPALWAYVRQAKPQVFYQSSAYLNGAPGPFLSNITFIANEVNPFEIRVKGEADVLNGAPGASFTLKMPNGGRLDSLGGFKPEWHNLSIKEFNDYMAGKISTAVRSYPAKKNGAVQKDIGDVLKKSLAFSRYQEGLVGLTLDKGKNYMFTVEQHAQDLDPRDAYALSKEDGLWRWHQQDLGNYYAEGAGTSTLRDPNINFIKESRLFVRLLKDKRMFPESKSWHRAGYQNQSDSGGHGLKAFFQRTYYSWIVLDQVTIDALGQAVSRLSEKYDLRAMVRKVGDEERFDLEGLLILLFLDQGGTQEELMNMAKADNASNVGGIDLDLTGKKIGVGQSGLDIGAGSADIIKGLVPVIIGQQKVASVADFVLQ